MVRDDVHAFDSITNSVSGLRANLRRAVLCFVCQHCRAPWRSTWCPWWWSRAAVHPSGTQSRCCFSAHSRPTKTWTRGSWFGLQQRNQAIWLEWYDIGEKNQSQADLSSKRVWESTIYETAKTKSYFFSARIKSTQHTVLTSQFLPSKLTFVEQRWTQVIE